MGLFNISDELEAQFEDTKVGGSKLPVGPYQGAITGIKVVTGTEKWKPWTEAALEIELTVEDTGSIREQYELAPLTAKDGNTSPGKLKFLKWQLGALGYEGKLKDLEAAIMRGEFHGNVVKFEVKENDRGYTEVLCKDFVEKGLGGMDMSDFAGQFDAVVV